MPEQLLKGGNGRLGSTAQFRIEDESQKGVGALLSAYGELDLHVAPELQDLIDSVADEGVKLIVLDLSEVTFIDSMAFGVLLRAVTRVRRSGGDVRLVVPSPELRRIFEITLLDQFFSLDSTREEAYARAVPSD